MRYFQGRSRVSGLRNTISRRHSLWPSTRLVSRRYRTFRDIAFLMNISRQMQSEVSGVTLETTLIRYWVPLVLSPYWCWKRLEEVQISW
jgi:hypothetical protein